MRLVTAVTLGKLICYLTKMLKIGGGSAAPGLYALRVEPDLVKILASQIPMNVVITGTNGKTTTAKMLALFTKSKQLKVIRNHTGSNLERGIASTLIQHSDLTLNGYRTNFDLGIWELDEAAFNTVAPKLRPDIIVFLNVFRDQLDRYGEIDTVIRNWCQTLKNIPSQTLVIVNGDDVNTAKLTDCFKGKIQKFGVLDHQITGESTSKTKRPASLDYRAQDIKLNGLNNSVFHLKIADSKLKINLPLPGFYHIYDFLAAFAAGSNSGFPSAEMISSLKDYLPAFGRVERLPFGYIFLIKNPAGATQVLKTIAPNIKSVDRLLIALNDNLADGADVSWIWDSQLELLPTTKSEQRIICSGTRAHDLALRLKYAGVNTKQITIEPDLKNALKEARQGLTGQLFILPTYTAMLELQSILVKTGIKKHYWKESD